MSDAMLKQKIYLISGSPGTGKTTLSQALAKEFDGHHITFIRNLAKAPSGRGSVLRVLKRAVMLGRSKVEKEAILQSYKEFMESGKTTLIIDGIFHPKEVNQIKERFNGMDIHQIFVSAPKKRRISFIQMRPKDKGGGSIMKARAWATVMDLLHSRMIGLANLRKLRLQSDIFIENDLPKEEFIKEAVRRINHLTE